MDRGGPSLLVGAPDATVPLSDPPPSMPAADAPCGFLVLDKPAGLTSHACVAAVRRRYGLRRVGHGGTLDPAVTGVLPIALGAATRLLPYLPGGKAYRGAVQLGVRTDSDDLSGTVLEQRPLPPLTRAELEAALAPFRGPIRQRPPQVSAVHVAGERAHARVRRGEVLELAERTVVIERLDLLGWDPASGLLELEVRCSAGTYIRSLARDLGEQLGCGGSLARLRRTEALGFDLAQAISLEGLQAGPAPLLDPLEALGSWPRRRLSELELIGWRCGRALPPLAADPEPAGPNPAAAGDAALDPAVVIVDPAGRLAGMARRRDDGWLQPRLVLDAAG